ncbi:uncharacterized protein LOC132644529 [Lycium barbarum]|uniref:uncharacterized protein LOC132644529 n=1 Tax=Lycium barbarum TaxID=112863 RepID=UPI00293F28C1|nr:uncharacterized protein LOC132644529 [Lycium barbarum]
MDHTCQIQDDELEAKFLEEKAALEAKYQQLYEPFNTEILKRDQETLNYLKISSGAGFITRSVLSFTSLIQNLFSGVLLVCSFDVRCLAELTEWHPEVCEDDDDNDEDVAEALGRDEFEDIEEDEDEDE